MILTKEIFDTIPDGEIFRIVTTKIQTVHESFTTELTFVCKKGHGHDWAIYFSKPDKPIEFIARHGDKVATERNIRGLCPCDDAVFLLYRY